MVREQGEGVLRDAPTRADGARTRRGRSTERPYASRWCANKARAFCGTPLREQMVREQGAGVLRDAPTRAAAC